MTHPHVSISTLVAVWVSIVQTATGISSAAGHAGEQRGDTDLSTRHSSLVRRESGAIDLEHSETQIDALHNPRHPHACTYFHPLKGQASCPNKLWIEAMVKADPSPGKVILDVGCNRGSSAIKWMELFDLSPTPVWNTKKWMSFFKDSMGVNETEMCPVSPPESLARHHSPDAYLSSRSFPRVICIESDPDKVGKLKEASTTLGYGEGTSFGSLQFVNAFVSNELRLQAIANLTSNSTTKKANSKQSVYGPSQPAYNTNLILTTPAPEVPRKTVDGLVSELELPRVDVLTMDVDGTDPDLLQGATKTLRDARYLEFSVHRKAMKTSWVNTTLQSVVTDLDSKGFDCFFAGNRGRLMPIQRCWKDEFEKAHGVKVACVKQGDIWSHPIGKFSGVW